MAGEGRIGTGLGAGFADHETRLRDLEKFSNQIKGAIWMLVFLSGLNVGGFLYLIVSGGSR